MGSRSSSSSSSSSSSASSPAVVVFSVGGISNKSKRSACSSDVARGADGRRGVLRAEQLLHVDREPRDDQAPALGAGHHQRLHDQRKRRRPAPSPPRPPARRCSKRGRSGRQLRLQPASVARVDLACMHRPGYRFARGRSHPRRPVARATPRASASRPCRRWRSWLRSWLDRPSRTMLRTACVAMSTSKAATRPPPIFGIKPLRDDRLERVGELHPDLLLLVGREHVDDRDRPTARHRWCAATRARGGRSRRR